MERRGGDSTKWVSHLLDGGVHTPSRAKQLQETGEKRELPSATVLRGVESSQQAKITTQSRHNWGRAAFFRHSSHSTLIAAHTPKLNQDRTEDKDVVCEAAEEEEEQDSNGSDFEHRPDLWDSRQN